MLLLSVLVCLSSLMQTSLSTPVSAAKPQPVELKYSCMAVIPADHQEIRPDDVPIILLHGLSGNKESWHGFFEVLALDTKKKVCIADLRNHGESPWNSDEYDVEAMTEDVKHLIDRLKAQKAIVLGHSMGGKVAVHLALTYPERVEKIIVEDMRANGISSEGLQEVQFYSKVMKDLEKDIPQGVSEIEAKKAFLKILNERLEKVDLSFKMDDLRVIPIKCSDGKCKWRFNSILLDALLSNPDELLNESSGRFDGPALFIYGGKSNFKVGEDESNIKKLFPNAKLVEVADRDHLVHTSKEFMREIVKFISDK
ncbi:protein ABHD11-like isoform X1 [Argiope bruennichi]|uniref:sn-1-specific diacylglycerol lipase ABHD11 n=1 Tax=Argiope bruennichi TaxID=94029 RepID=A0A8T0FLD7_ARGBR|nr:protein ABHD11-like isoform X1 [Argiope bruennichi]KAF8791038.1 Protein ABHD11 like protein [Argiope bruennichi]